MSKYEVVRGSEPFKNEGKENLVNNLGKPKNAVPNPVRRMGVEVLSRLQAPQPEGFHTSGLKVVKPSSTILGRLPILALICALGLLVVSASYGMLRFNESPIVVEFVFLLGLLLIFVPALVRLISNIPSRFERICLVSIVGMCFYLVQELISPLYITSYDEFLHWRTAADIVMTGHLFTPNALLPASSYYPGLEIVTNAFSTMSGLSIFHSGLVVVAAAHLVMLLSLFLLYEQLTNSIRMASIATIIYMTNMHFVFFDVQFSYETLGLSLAIFMFYALTRYWTVHNYHPKIIAAAWIALAAITLIHHVSNYIFDGLLVLWAIVNVCHTSSFTMQRAFTMKKALIAIAVFGVMLSVAYAILPQGNPVWSYLYGYFNSTFIELIHVINGTGAARPLFMSNTGIQTPIWDKLLMIASLGLVLFGIPFGLLSLWKQHRHNALALTFGITTLLFPVSQIFKFTAFGADITDRSAAFLFLPLAYTLTVLITQLWPTRKINWKATTLITSAITVIFLGNVILGSGPSLSNLSGPYLVVDDVRSIEPEGINAALWTLPHLGPNNRVSTDRINHVLMGTYGNQRVVTSLSDHVDVTPVFFDASFGPKEVSILRDAKIRYLVVDLRLSTSLPVVGVYFENPGEGGFAYTTPISIKVLTKFNAVPGILRIFDSGNIVIYDVGGLTNAS